MKIKTWDDLRPKLQELLDRELNSPEQADNWLKEKSKIFAYIEEEAAWRYIRMTANTEDSKLEEEFKFFVTQIEPKVKEFAHKLNLKLYQNKFFDFIEKKYPVYAREIKREIELFTPENIQLEAQEETLAGEYGKITGAMTVSFQGKELTMQQAGKLLYEKDRSIREKIYRLMSDRRLQDKDKLNDLLDKLIEVRTKIAANAGFDNYRDYKHYQLQRFDYTVDDVLKFHQTVKEAVMPIVEKTARFRKEKLKLKHLKPWDLKADLEGKPPLTPFDNADTLIDKSIKVLSRIDKDFGNFLKIMNERGFLDLESRKGKAPGGYNYPLYVSNIPFIFMNASGTVRDVVTLLHESGHAVHSFLSANLPLTEQKETPSEVAELASMSMELISMEHWNIFFENEDDLKRAKIQHLEDIISVLPWIVAVDKFQHKIYTTAKTRKDRYLAWGEILDEYYPSVINWDTVEWQYFNLWQKQLHIYEVPFYYIEYAFAQLGAIAMWRNYKNNPQKTLENYKKALSAGYTLTIPEIYKMAGINFDFSEQYVKELMDFVLNEFDKLAV